MPDTTQQQWLEGLFGEWDIVQPLQQALAEDVIDLWPSSPQGLAVKQLMEAAQAAYYDATGKVQETLSNSLLTSETIDCLESALAVARKAGVR